MVNDTISRLGYSTSISIEGDRVVASGQANTVADVIDCVTTLENLDYFSEVRIDEIDIDEAGESPDYEEPEVSFTLVLTR
ncbi:MAG: PilN domain-containing protein [Dehalococcoidales bacterium]|nr:MAG: PilN domain-containing protein [Dehalococcoidales bacterium]